MLAFWAYRADYGQFPGSADALVPAYLPAIAIDDFDGQPLRLSEDATFLYSVGEDFTDDGGQPKRDVVFPLR